MTSFAIHPSSAAGVGDLPPHRAGVEADLDDLPLGSLGRDGFGRKIAAANQALSREAADRFSFVDVVKGLAARPAEIVHVEMKADVLGIPRDQLDKKFPEQSEQPTPGWNFPGTGRGSDNPLAMWRHAAGSDQWLPAAVRWAKPSRHETPSAVGWSNQLFNQLSPCSPSGGIHRASLLFFL